MNHDHLADLDHLEQLAGQISSQLADIVLLRPQEGLPDRVTALCELHQRLRERWAPLLEPPCTSGEELRGRLTLGDIRSRLSAIVDQLEHGTLLAKGDAIGRKHKRSLQRAIDELHGALAQETQPPLPGPSIPAVEWLRWAWQHAETLEVSYADLHDFLLEVPQDCWHPPAPGPVSPPEPPETPEPAQASVPAPLDPPPKIPPELSGEATQERAAEETAKAPTPSPPPPEARAHRPKPVSNVPVSLPGGRSARRPEELSDSELIRLFDADEATAERNADEILGIAANREIIRDRKKRVSGEYRREFEKRGLSLPSDTFEPDPSSGATLGLLGVLAHVKGPHPEPLSKPRPASIPALPDFPATLLTFDSFRREHWIDLDGQCRRAPWRSPDFSESLHRGLQDALRELRMFEAVVFARALDADSSLWQEDLEAIGDLLSAEHPEVAGRDEQRRVEIDAALEKGQIDGTPRWRLRVLLEFLRPAASASHLPPHRKAATQMGLSGAWLSFAFLLEDCARRGFDLAEAWRDRSSLREAGGEEGFEERRRLLQKTFTRLYSAAGGKVTQTHCRDAWSRFIETLKPQITPLFPCDAEGNDDWDAETMMKLVQRIPKLYDKIAERGEVRHGDRRDMDKAAQSIVDAAMSVVEGRRLLEQRSHQRTGWKPDLELVESILDVRHESFDLDLFVAVLRRVLGLDAARPATLSRALVCAHPELLECLPSETLSARDTSTEVRGKDIDDPLKAAALLLRDPELLSTEEDLVAAITRRGLLHLLPRLRDRMDDQRRHGVDHHRQELMDELLELQGQLQELHTGLDHLGSAHVRVVHDILSDSERQLDRESREDGRLFNGWLAAVRDVARQTLAIEQQSFIAGITNPGQRALVERLLRERAWAEAIRVTDVDTGERPGAPIRESPWRNDAEVRFSDPREWLLHESELSEDFRLRWSEQQPNATRQKGLRSAFALQVLGALADKGDKGERWTISMREIQTAIDEEGRNPCFIPQLSRHALLSIETLSTAADRGAFSKAAADHLARPDSTNPLRILLAPGLTRQNRENTLRELHRRGASAAVLDDIDLCRILRAQSDQRSGLIAMLEIALEQLPLGQVMPFEAGEGQHVQPEMFVGRRQEARDIATAKTYTRLFSGRKLGKSALLRAIQHRHANWPLPDGRILRVIYVPLVSTPREQDVVAEIASAIRRELGATCEQDPSADPPRQLRTLVEDLCAKRPGDSFIFVCDEADQFVERQIQDFRDRRNEEGLSWTMRNLEHLPCRFLFAGYRATYRSDGVWENWGQTLKLKPLEPDEAESLVVQPLARIGIDASAHGRSIAHRCGYQPAILLRFGRALLEQLRLDASGFGRSGIKVTAAQVSRAYADPSVQEEIKTVVRANFHNSPIAEIVFCAMLLELANLPAGAYVDDAPARIAASIEDEAVGLKNTGGRSLQAIVDEALRELSDRRLLVKGPHSEGPGRYRLRYPHHLSVLLDLEPERLMKNQLKQLASGATDDSLTLQGLLEPARIDEIKACMESSKELHLAAVVLASPWEAAVTHHNGLIGALFGSMNSIETPKYPCSVKQAERLVRERRPSVLPGSADLLRWALRAEVDPEFDGLLEVVTLGRLSVAAVGWWLRAREIEFTVPDGVARIYQATRGIPDLLALVDRMLHESVDGRTLNDAIQNAEQKLAIGGPDYLTPNERALLRLIVAAHDVLDPHLYTEAKIAKDLCEALGDPSVLRAMGLDPEPAEDPNLGQHIRFLQGFGWLPILPGTAGGLASIGRIERDDPVRRILGR